ncbi:MAG: hypothetical protein ISN29_12700, partial [Gammaproteobacteria bacterium AqS3]|nr:hypothetical protein [Gammaproteobacteria bacterium AqS3]
MTASGGGYDGVSESVTFTIFENDLLVLGNTPSDLPEGSSTIFTVRLSVRPSENMTVTVQPSANFNRLNATFDTDADAPGNQHTLTFTPTNWHIEQLVTVSAAADAFATFPLINRAGLHVILPNGGRKALSITPVRANTSQPHFDMSPNVLTLDGSSSKTITVRMLSPPSSRITLQQSHTPNGISTDKDSVTFTPSNWNTPQTVTLSALEDDDARDERGSFCLNGGVRPSRTDYCVTYLVRDNDLGLNISATTVWVPEDGSAMFTVRLNSLPSGTVTVNVPHPLDPDLTVDTDPLTSGNQNTLTFTPSNWSTPQTVKVSAAEDADAIFETGDINLTVSGNETDYAGRTGRVHLNVYENDFYPIIETASDPLVVPEGGSATFTVRMAAAIRHRTTVSLEKARSKKNQNKDVTFDADPHTAGKKKRLRFTRDNWNIPQTVTVSAAEDDDELFETERLILFHSYNNNRYFGILVADNDTAGLVLSTTSLNIPEGGSNDFSVVLTTQPSGDVTVQLAQESPDNADVALDESSLTFTSENWNTPQTVRVSAGQDD